MFYEPKDGHGLPHNPFNALITPRPVGWISTRDADGIDNLAPYSFFNGVFGHKPSSGLVPNSGQWPLAENEAASYLTTGPLARRAEDLWPLLQVLAGPDGNEAASQSSLSARSTTVSPGSIRTVGGGEWAQPEARSARQSVRRMRRSRAPREVQCRTTVDQMMNVWQPSSTSTRPPASPEICVQALGHRMMRVGAAGSS